MFYQKKLRYIIYFIIALILVFVFQNITTNVSISIYTTLPRLIEAPGGYLLISKGQQQYRPNIIIFSVFVSFISSIFIFLLFKLNHAIRNHSIINIFSSISKKCLEKIAPETWEKTSDCFLDILESFPDEINTWKKRNLKYIGYFIFYFDLAKFFLWYFPKTTVSKAIKTRKKPR